MTRESLSYRYDQRNQAKSSNPHQDAHHRVEAFLRSMKFSAWDIVIINPPVKMSLHPQMTHFMPHGREDYAYR